MSFISYAQNTEDVLLWRALGHVQAGFYIDVGANDPVEHSVTKAFYDAGWRGINIEPLPSFHAAFTQQRPRDINLAVAAGAQDGEVVLYDVTDVNGWATSAPDVAATHRAEGHAVVELKVPLLTLDTICAEHVSGPIHFLKIDVEGFEREVLLGLDLQRWRPWILVIEATMPNSRQTNHETWEGLVTPHGYEFAYFDGLNRYYVAAEQRALMAQLQVQANVFDDFISRHLDHAWKANAALQQSLQQAQEQAQVQRAQLDQLDQLRQRELREQLLQVERSVALQQQALAARQAVEARLAEREQELGAARAREEELSAHVRLAHEHLQVQNQALAALQAKAEGLEQQLHAANAWGNGLAATLDAVHNSTSWRLSKPVRLAGRVYRRLAVRQPGAPEFNRPAAVAAIKRNTLQRLRTIAGSPLVRTHVLPPLLRVPGARGALLRLTVALRDNAPAGAVQASLPPGAGELSPLARQALAELERARRRSSNP